VKELSAPLPGLSSSGHADWPVLAEQPLLVLVGVTGVGKSTALAALGSLKVLPDRREVTDAVMIRPLAGRAVTDREERFAMTARYRELHPGGMAQALGTLHADPSVWGGPLVFDGLRGREEVEYAIRTFPAWRFVSLRAPDLVRVRRLLGRADRFDTAGKSAGELQGTGLLRALNDLPGAAQVFTPAERSELAALEAAGFTPADILAKTRIVVSERRHYDPQAARSVLAPLPAARHLELDTDALSPQEVAARIRTWLPVAIAALQTGGEA
jgi:hypothetical protein